MDLRQLQYFFLVSKHKSFTLAAKELFVAQPSVTIAIRNLEEELGVNLFIRNQKKVEITNEGKIFLNRIEKILKDLDEAILEIKDINNLTKGTIKFGLPPMIGAYLFPNFFVNFKKIYPNLDLLVYEEGSAATLSKIENGELDLGIIIVPELTKNINVINIITEEIVLCLPPTHSLNMKNSISFLDLENEKFISLKEDSYIPKLISDQCLKNNFTPNIIFSSSQIETIKSLVAKGAGIAFLLNMVAKNQTSITTVPLSTSLKIDIGLAWNKNKYLSKASKAFIDFITSYKLSI